MKKPGQTSTHPSPQRPAAPRQAVRPTAPPAFRPQSTPKCLQLKSALPPARPPSQPKTPPAAPPVYRPAPRPVVQPKAAAHVRLAPQAPPVYRPLPNPHGRGGTPANAALQMKPATVRPRACEAAQTKNPVSVARTPRHTPPPPPVAPNRPRPHVGPQRPGHNCVQRTTVVIGYQSTDTMFQAALGGITNPNPIYAFTDQGIEDLSAAAEITKTYGEGKGSDATKLHIVSHGSPGKLASVKNVDGLLSALEAKVDFGPLTNIELSPCYAMTRRDVDDSSLAYKVAKWAQSKLGTHQALNIRAGYTENTAGEYAKGNPSYNPISDLKHELGAQEIANYLYFSVKKKLTVEGMTSEEWNEIREAVLGDIGFAAADAIEEIVKAAPKSIWKDGERVMGQNIRVGKDSIAYGGSDEANLKRGFTVASATQANYADFPRRMISLTSLGKMTGDIEAAFDKQIRKLCDEHKPKPKPSVGFGSLPDTGFGVSTTFTFGTGFTFNPQTTTTPPPTTQPTFTFGGPPTGGFTFGTPSDKSS